MKPADQTTAIRERLDAGERASAIAEAFGISRQRVHQIAHPDKEKARRQRIERRKREAAK